MDAAFGSTYHTSASILSPLSDTPSPTPSSCDSVISREKSRDDLTSSSSYHGTQRRLFRKAVAILTSDELKNDRVEEESRYDPSEDCQHSASDDDDVSGYETDLDIEKDKELRMSEQPKEREDVEAYLSACKDLDVVPQTAVLAMLSQPGLLLNYRCLGPVGAKALALGLMHNIHVEFLDLKYNGLLAEGATYICEMLLETDTIQKVDLSGNELGSQGALVVSEMMRLNRGISHLIVSANGFVDSDSEVLAAGIQANETIRELDISNNGLSIIGGRALGAAMVVNYTIRHLDLSWNHIREKGAVALCKGLEENVSLTHLHLSNNGFGYHGSLAIQKLLKANRVLKYLDISNNRITWDAILLICKGIKVNDALATLKIGHNPLTTTGCMDIIDAVSSNHCIISELDLENVCVLGEFDMMATAIGQTRTFHYTHGGVVGTHDVLGERHDKRITPMQRVITYMKKRGLRATELFRSMDKQVANKITHQEMIVRLKNAGIDMQMYEVVELLDHLERNASNVGDPDGVNYKNVSRSVQDQIMKDRMERIRKRENIKRLESYHKDILKQGRLPPIVDTESDGVKTMTMGSDQCHTSVRSMSRLSLDSSHGPDTAGSGSGTHEFFKMRREVLAKTLASSSQTTNEERSILKGNLKRDSFRRSMSSSTFAISLELLPAGAMLTPVSGATISSSKLSSKSMSTIGGKKAGILSMSRPLGSKPVAFGTVKKKKKKRGRKSQR